MELIYVASMKILSFVLRQYCLFIGIILLGAASAWSQVPTPKQERLGAHAYDPSVLIVKFRKVASARIAQKILPQVLDKEQLSGSTNWKVEPLVSTNKSSHKGTFLDDLLSFVKVEFVHLEDAKRARQQLSNEQAVEQVYFAFRPAPPPIRRKDIAPTTPQFSRRQRYTAAAPTGLDFKFARSIVGGRGLGVQIFDVEYGWNLRHEDLPISAASLIYANSNPSYPDHGTAVAGILSGIKNRYGVEGVVNQSTLWLAPAFDLNGQYNLPAAIYNSVQRSNPGDIILLEQQLYGPDLAECACGTGCDYYVPVEYDPATFSAIQYAVSQGRIVVEAAANGGVDLDSEVFSGLFNPALHYSGAIMVGAISSVDRSTPCFSNRGSRLNLNAWGDRVVTTGYADLFPSEGVLRPKAAARQAYTSQFSGTSSASALVAGAAASLQGVAIQRGAALTPDALLSYLFDFGVATQANNVGRTPNLRASIEKLLQDRN